MPEENQDVTIYRGDSKVLRITIKDENDAPFNLSGADVHWWMSKSWRDTGAAVLLKKSTVGAAGISVTPPNIVEIAITADDVGDISPGSYYHEVKIVKGDDVSTALTGHIIVKNAFNMVA